LEIGEKIVEIQRALDQLTTLVLEIREAVRQALPIEEKIIAAKKSLNGLPASGWKNPTYAALALELKNEIIVAEKLLSELLEKTAGLGALNVSMLHYRGLIQEYTLMLEHLKSISHCALFLFFQNSIKCQ
jgi:hypothetical protein